MGATLSIPVNAHNAIKFHAADGALVGGGPSCGLRAVGQHAPNLHVARAVGIEVDVLAVRRIIGAVVQAAREKMKVNLQREKDKL